MVLTHKILLCLSSVLFASCLNSSSKPPALWVKALDSEINSLGALNWIIVTDSSFPALGNSVSHTIISPTDLPSTLHEVIQSMESSGHVKPRIYVTRESQELQEDYAPGITRHREKLHEALHGYEAYALPESTMRSIVLESGKKYRILVIKSQTSLPYTSVYVELESGYWDSESETALRKHMENGR
ncbi:hypothetical protein Rhal01_00077 [Rubritalea halochordaticola]|uniref:D-ribose pyranase n=1 Tax=Rubritalea halochordaticola TaxID=714537 RepID=A0ABP9UW36_9BACT